MTGLVRGVLIFLGLLILGVLGLEMLLWAVVLDTPDYDWFLSGLGIRFQDIPSASRYALAALLILVPCFVASLTLRLRKEEVVLAAQSEQGDAIYLTESAVQRCLRREITTIPEVAGLISTARNGEKGPRVHLRALLRAGADVPATQREIRVRALRAMRHLFGVGDLEQIQVVIAGLVFPPREKDAVGARKPRLRRSSSPPSSSPTPVSSPSDKE
jgi:hypothetical protein